MICGHFDAELDTLNALLLVAAPMLAWIAQIWRHHLSELQTVAAQLALVLAAACIALGRAAWAFSLAVANWLREQALTRDQYGCSAHAAAAKIVERLIGLSQRVSLRLDAKIDSRGQRQEFFAIAARQVGH